MHMGQDFAGSAEIIATLEVCVTTLNAKGFQVTAHLLEMAVLDLKCRVHGISKRELALLGLVALNALDHRTDPVRAEQTTPEKLQ
jgi:hypothetical protein